MNPRGIRHIRAEGGPSTAPRYEPCWLTSHRSVIRDRTKPTDTRGFPQEISGCECPRTAKYNRLGITDQAHILWRFRPDFLGSFHRRPSKPRVAVAQSPKRAISFQDTNYEYLARGQPKSRIIAVLSPHPPVIGPHAPADLAVVITGFADRGSAGSHRRSGRPINGTLRPGQRRRPASLIRTAGEKIEDQQKTERGGRRPRHGPTRDADLRPPNERRFSCDEARTARRRSRSRPPSSDTLIYRYPNLPIP